jgi:hypothetical protein
MTEDEIIVVSGLPRSGTSMMMSVLTAGGIPALLDGERRPDESNPKGYFEFEKVKQLERDRSFLADAKGKVVKIVSPLLKHLPGDYSYRVVFMLRNIQEILASQRQMMLKLGEQVDVVSDQKMEAVYGRHLKDVDSWLAARQNFEVLRINYNQMLQDPAPHIDQIMRFFAGSLNSQAMLSEVDQALYRQRRP